MLSEPADNSIIAGSSRFSFPDVISESTAHSRSVLISVRSCLVGRITTSMPTTTCTSGVGQCGFLVNRCHLCKANDSYRP
jgi:hypothetical protein